MKRTQLFLEDEVWSTLRLKAKTEHTTISELVRRAIRERYLNGHPARAAAMTEFIGIWKDRPEFSNPETYVRRLRQDRRLDRIRVNDNSAK